MLRQVPGNGANTLDRATAIAPHRERGLHRAADGLPFIAADLSVSATVGNNLHRAIGQ